MVAEATRRSGPWAALAVAVALPAVLYFTTGDRNLNLADEGYLWYGVQRTVAGEVPLRDFQAYDPGRYHWCALFAPLFGTGILGVRAALAIYQALGLLCGLLVTRRFAPSALATLFLGLLLELWMFPRHKLFEPATALMTAWFAVRLLERPSVGRHLVTGIFVGLAGYVGRNLGLYAGLATGALVLWNGWRRPEPGFLRRAAAWAGGVLAGFAPMWVLLLLVPGFAGAFAESLRVILKEGANLPRPWPWPWRVGEAGPATATDWIESVAFLFPLLGAIPLLVVCARARGAELARRAACLAPAVVGLVFLHHVSVRSDTPHLAQCLPPLLLAVLALPATLEPARRVATLLTWGLVAVLTGAVAWTANPYLTTTFGRATVEREVAGETLRLMPPQAAYLDAVEGAVRAKVGAAPLFIAPNRPTLYPVLGKTAPTWWIYYFWNASEAEQRATIARLAERHVDWALVVEAPSDDREELLFRNTNPLVWKHFLDEWELERVPTLPRDHLLLHRR